jgi:hypothetical protein
MDESELNRYLKRILDRPVPNLPSDFQESVFAKIRNASNTRENWLDAFVSTFLRPQWAIAALVVTLLISMNLGRMLADSENVPSRPLGLEAFAADAPLLPSTLLNRSR